MAKNKRNISLSIEEVELLLSCLDTSIIYLHNCSSRFKLLNIRSYLKPINRGIENIINLSNKFNKLYSKFDNCENEYFNDAFSIKDILKLYE